MDAYKNENKNRPSTTISLGVVELSLLHVFVGQIPLSKERDFSTKESVQGYRS
jgi:hypothetical protein